MIKGIYAPIPTPFVNDEIAWDKLDENLDKWCQTDLAGFVIGGSNGEVVLLDEDEKVKLVEFVVKKSAGRKKVIVGTGCESTRATIRLTKRVAEFGIQAALIITPNYYKGSMKEPVLERFFTDCAEASPVPVFLYNMPGNTGINMSSDLILTLSQHPNIVGVKDSSGNMVQISEILAGAPKDFAVFAGSGSFLLLTLVMGGVGGTLAVANILPNHCAKIQKLFETGNLAAAAELQKQILSINKAVTGGFGIPGLKAAMDLLGYYGGEPRRPLLPVDEKGRARLRELLVKVGALEK